MVKLLFIILCYGRKVLVRVRIEKYNNNNKISGYGIEKWEKQKKEKVRKDVIQTMREMNAQVISRVFPFFEFLIEFSSFLSFSPSNWYSPS